MKFSILKKIYPLIIMLLIGLVLIFYGYAKVRVEYGVHIYPNSDELFSEPLQSGDALETAFTAPDHMKLDSVGLLFVDYGVENTGGIVRISAVNTMTGEKLGSGEIPVKEIIEWEWQDIALSGAAVNAGEEILVSITAEGFPEGTALSLVLSKDGGHPALRVKTDYMDPFQRMQLLLSLIVLALIAFVYTFLYLKKLRIEYVFLVTFVIMGFLFNLLIPAKLGPDEEGMHLNAAYKIAERIEGWEAPSDDVSMITIEEKYNGLKLTMDDTGHDYYASYYGWLFSRSDQSEIEPFGYWGIGENPVITYVPAALGIVVGRALHLSAAGIIVFGRIFAFVPVVFFLFYAVKRIPFGKEILFAIAMLPIMLQQSSTVNADGIDIALSFALIAAVFRILFGERDKWRFLDYGILIFTMLMLYRCKYGALVPLCMLPLLIFWKKKGAIRELKKSLQSREGLEEVILALGGLVLPLVCVVFGFIPLFHSTVTGFGAGGWDTFYSFSDIVSDPLGMLYLLGSTIYQKLDFYILSLSGTYLGWMNILLPEYLTITMLIIVVIASIPKESEQALFPASRKVFLFLIAFLGIGFAIGGMLIGWTKVGSDFIDGVQGRYFLPFLPPLIFALQPKFLRAPEDGSIQKKAVMAAVFMQIWIVTALFVRAQ